MNHTLMETSNIQWGKVLNMSVLRFLFCFCEMRIYEISPINTDVKLNTALLFWGLKTKPEPISASLLASKMIDPFYK